MFDSDLRPYDPSKPTLLFLSPITPSQTGHGSAMRAFQHVRLLSDAFNIRLLVIHWYRPLASTLSSDNVRSLCQSVTVLPNGCSETDLSAALEPLLAGPVGVIHAFRLRMAPLSLSICNSLGYRPYMVLDSDDFESKKALRIAERARSEGDLACADSAAQAADMYRSMETNLLPKFDRIYISNPDDREEISQLVRARTVKVVPNGIAPRPKRPKRIGRLDAINMLFVGTMHYYPNYDAVMFLGTELLPLIRQSVPIRTRMTVIGTSPSNEAVAFCASHNIDIYSNVYDLDHHYERADICLVPLRVGGGTRVKILEAIAHCTPVITTGIGAEGLSFTPGIHYLRADLPKEFASAVSAIAFDTDLYESLSSSAYDWLVAHHSDYAISKALDIEALSLIARWNSGKLVRFIRRSALARFR